MTTGSGRNAGRPKRGEGVYVSGRAYKNCSLMISFRVVVNPFTAPSLSNFRAEGCTDAPANSIFSGPVTSILNAMRFDENPF